MKRILFILFLLTLALPSHAQGRRSGDTKPATPEHHALEELLIRIPAGAQQEVYMFDLAASRRQILPLLSAKLRPADIWLAPWATAVTPHGFDLESLYLHTRNPRAALGFSPFDIDQLVGWGQPPSAPVILTGIEGAHDAIEAALNNAGLTPRDLRGQTVWHLQDDFQIDLNNRNANPFGGRLGMAQRIALTGDMLLSDRSWAGIETLISPGASLAGDADAQAILQATYALTDAGEVIHAVLVPGQPVKAPDPALLLGISEGPSMDEAIEELRARPEYTLPGLPPFLRYGIVLWQDGYRTTGALVIPYASAESAEQARGRFAALLEAGTSTVANKPFTDVLPFDRRFETIETGKRSVLVLGFEEVADRSEPVTLHTFAQNPAKRLYGMMIRRELPLLIGASPD